MNSQNGYTNSQSYSPRFGGVSRTNNNGDSGRRHNNKGTNKYAKNDSQNYKGPNKSKSEVEKISKLNHSNYYEWVRKMVLLLQEKGLSHHLQYENFYQYARATYDSSISIINLSVDPTWTQKHITGITLSTTPSVIQPTNSSLINQQTNFLTTPFKPLSSLHKNSFTPTKLYEQNSQPPFMLENLSSFN